MNESSSGEISRATQKAAGPLLSLLAVAVEIAWLGVLFLGYIFMVGDQPPTTTPAQEQLFNLIAALPAMAGCCWALRLGAGMGTNPRSGFVSSWTVGLRVIRGQFRMGIFH